MDERKKVLYFLGGMGLVLVLHTLFAAIAIPLLTIIFEANGTGGGYSGIAALFVVLAAFSLWQLLYVVPLSLWFKRKRKFAAMKGVIAMAALTFLLNSACFVMMQI